MKAMIENIGAHPLRVIVDHDTVNDEVLEPGASERFEGEVVELRALLEDDDEEDEVEAAFGAR